MFKRSFMTTDTLNYRTHPWCLITILYPLRLSHSSMYNVYSAEKPYSLARCFLTSKLIDKQ